MSQPINPPEQLSTRMDQLNSRRKIDNSREFLAWSEELSVGIQEIDEQHKILAGLTNCLFNEAILNKADPAIVESILNELMQYTQIHFSVEESLFRIFNYPEADSHQQHHTELKKEVFEIKEKFLNGDSVDLELMHLLREWLTKHIMIEDKQYTQFFLSKGLKANWPKSRSWIGKIWDSMHLQ
ncbi:MAG TPA: bacteriohemerythrin [Candidatus Competibacter sp.]|nr:bacteriohemerythrin [Candidatus Competibacter sp.]